MSVRTMARVWALSKHKGSALLLLLAIADNTDDAGYGFPGIEYLSHKTRLSERQTIRLIKTLEESNELWVRRERKNNEYLITLPLGDNTPVCTICGTPETVEWDPNTQHHKYHIKPREEGGGDEPENIQIMCKACHTAHHMGTLIIGDKLSHDTQGSEIAPDVTPQVTPSAVEPSLTINKPESITGTDVPGTLIKGVSVDDMAYVVPDPGDPEEPTYEPIGNEFGDGRGFDSNENQGGVTKKSSIPKWKIIPAEAMQYAKHWKIKYFRWKGDKANWRQLKHSLEQGLVTEEWVEQVLEWATRRPEGKSHPIWKFGGFLKCAADREKYSDWEIGRTNALRHGGDAKKFSGTLEELDEYYSD